MQLGDTPQQDGGSMTKYEMEVTADWLHFCELMTNATIRKYADFAGVDADLRGQILKEQNRRRRELRKLRNSLEAEITAKRGKGAAADAP